MIYETRGTGVPRALHIVAAPCVVVVPDPEPFDPAPDWTVSGAGLDVISSRNSPASLLNRSARRSSPPTSRRMLSALARRRPLRHDRTTS
jgi:hypothetical protein